MMACAERCTNVRCLLHEPVARQDICGVKFVQKVGKNAHRGQESKRQRKIDREEEERREIAGVYPDAPA